HHRAHLAYALVYVEEHDKENERHPQGNFGGDAQTEPYEEDRREDHPRHGVDRLDVWIAYRRGGGRKGEPQADRHAGHRADEKRKQGLDQSNPEVFVDFPRSEPSPEASEHLDRFAEKERRLVGFGKEDRWQHGRARQYVPKQ